jgi:hypothetical protein
LALGQRHLAVRRQPYRRPRGGAWRALAAAGLIAVAGYGVLTLVQRMNASLPGQVGAVVVRDAYSGAPLAGARVTIVPLLCPNETCAPAESTPQGIVARAFTTDSRGEIHPAIRGDRVEMIAEERDYDTRRLDLTWPPSEGINLALRPAWLSGRITTQGAPLAHATVRAVAAGSDQGPTATTDADGHYRLDGVPEDAALVVDAPNVSPRPHPIGRQTTLDLALRPDVVTGVVRDPGGNPVPGLTVAAGGVVGQTNADGAYRLPGVDENATLIVKGVGYRAQQIPLGSRVTQDVTVQPFVAKGLYAQAPTVADPQQLQKLLALIDAKDLNTLVIDLKDNNGIVYYDSHVPLAREVSAVQPTLNVPALLATLRARNVYAIARIVVMEDPIAATKRPDLAIKDARTGKVWRTTQGQPWLNPTNPQVWAYVSDLAKEAADLGFDEVQFDYVRFPSDGALNAAEYGPSFTGGAEQRRAMITGFLKTAREKLAPTPALMGADIFGITAWLKGDNGIGQQFEDLAALVDVICPMDYPSHFSAGFNGWDIPNNYPYEVIKQSLMVREQRIPGVAHKTRPWLQAFTLRPGVDYGTAQVYAQIQACNEMQSSGFLLWNANSDYDPAWLPPKATG